MFIQTQQTPNPLTLKFFPGVPVMGDRPPMEVRSISQATGFLLAQKLLNLGGIHHLFFAQDFVSVTKYPEPGWSALKPDILGTLVDYFTLHTTVDVVQTHNDLDTATLSQVEKEIKAIIDKNIRPAVAMDGGDIVFEKFEKGIVYLRMRGACSGCPSSTITLKSGIETMLKHYIPEVKSVQALETIVAP